MCCLGFYALQCGYTVDDIVEQFEPADLVNNTKKNCWPDWCVAEGLCEYFDSNDVNELIKINDSEIVSEQHRESAISKIFARHGVEVEFI
jgi:hypothetical protein